ncbi:MBL fold metallo-hydrolase [Atopobium fossor]|uniref:MBL fold metallo-hydrolase n=1 Tax=Atopobium fossor TaxID=39487 RepID=UPI0004023C32|nr:MBL fold metallo-hydrolase [Atopobium fossor]
MSISFSNTVPYGHDTIHCFAVGPISTNCYAYVSGEACLVIDPGFDGKALASQLEHQNLTTIVATHGHGDHVGGVAELMRPSTAFLINEKDLELAQSPNAAGHRPGESLPPTPTGFLSEGNIVSVGTARFRIIETPGHTPGGVCLVGQGSAEGLCFTGDTLFAGSAGRTDLPGGNFDQLIQSLARLRKELTLDCVVLPGHGGATSMREELATNRFYQ